MAFPALASPPASGHPPDTPLTSAVHVVAGGSLIWLAVAAVQSRYEAGTAMSEAVRR